MNEIDRLAEWLKLMRDTGAADDMDPKAAWADAALKGYTVEDLNDGRIAINGDTAL